MIIGDNSEIGINAQISRGVSIGNNVMMELEVVILATSHEHKSFDVPMFEQGPMPIKNVVIKDIWIGKRVIILPGVVIENGTIIGEGSVLTKSFLKFSVIAGNPARLMKNRLKN